MLTSPQRLIASFAACLVLLALTGCAPPEGRIQVSLPYSNDFADSCDLPDGGDSTWSQSCADGHYEIAVKSVHLGVAELGLEQATSAVAVESDTGFVHGADGSSDEITGYGVACLTAGTGEPSGYLFLVGPDGSWAIMRKTPAGFGPIAQSGADDMVPPSRLADIRGICLAATADRPALLLLQLDGVTVGGARDPHPFPSFQQVGVVVFSTQPGGEARFDNLRVTRPSAEQIGSFTSDAARSVPWLPLQDDFSDASSGWPSAGYAGGGYRLSTGPGGASRWASREFLPSQPSVAVDVTAQHAAGPATLGYGVTCFADDRHGYGFQVSPSGGWDIFAQRGAATVDLASGSMTLTTPARPLRIRAECVADRNQAVLLLFANGKQVGEARDLTGDLGPYTQVGVVTSGVAGDVVQFDDFAARPLTANDAAEARNAPPPNPNVAVPAGSAPPVSHTAGTLFTDRFSRNLGYWPLKNYKNEKTALRAGRYQVMLGFRNGLEAPQTRLLRPAPAITIDVDLAERRSPLGTGVACLDADGNGFTFLIDSDTGRYAVWAEQGDEGTEIGQGQSPAIHPGGVNHLTATCGSGGADVAFAVNGHSLASARSGQAVGDYARVGLHVETARKPADVAFDNLIVRAAQS